MYFKMDPAFLISHFLKFTATVAYSYLLKLENSYLFRLQMYNQFL